MKTSSSDKSLHLKLLSDFKESIFMSDSKELVIQTESIGRGFAKTNNVVLEITPTTALIFSPEIHAGGVRGNLVRFKKNKDDKWEELEKVDFRSLKLHEGAKIELGTAQLQKLLDEVSQRQKIVNQGVDYGYNEYRLLEENDNVLVVNDKNKKEILEQILSSGYSDDFWELLRVSNPGLADKLSSGHIHMYRQNIVSTLEERLNGAKSYPETSGDNSWQKWIYDNNWLFGVSYLGAIQKRIININGIMPDYLFLTTDGFIDVLEIKLPSMEVVLKDSFHTGSWVWSSDANKAIGQVVNYLSEIDRLQLEIEKQLQKQFENISILKPRAYILIGNSENWDKEKKEGLRKLNHSLHGIEVITYHNLKQRGSLFAEAGAGIKESFLSGSHLVPRSKKWRPRDD